MNELKIFNYEEKEVRTVQKDGETWWVLKDICSALGISNPTIVADRLDNDEKDIFKTNSDLVLNVPNRGVTIVNESGLYNVIIRSDKPGAKSFKRWITHEVLPSIRKNGMYAADELLDNPDFLLQVATTLKAEREKNRKLTEDNSRMRPKEIFADAVCASHTSILIGELSKILRQNGVEIGQNRMFDWLRSHGYLITCRSDRNMPTQRSMELGLFQIKERTINNPDGSVRITKTVMVTGKGQQYFINKFLGLGA